MSLKIRHASLTGTEMAGSPRRFAARINRIRSPEKQEEETLKMVRGVKTMHTKQMYQET